MKKNTIKAFTLVEMLIVIVIIGILIAALMPRMQAAQWRARDVSRKTALSQIQSAIVVSQWDKWQWPKAKSWTTDWPAINWMAVGGITEELKNAWMNSIPTDPLKNAGWAWLWTFSGNSEWDYGYLVAKRNWSKNWWFVLMAQTEVEWWSNWVYCSGSTDNSASGGLNKWAIVNNTDIAKLTLCQTVSKRSSTGTTGCVTNTGTCYYQTEDQLRYVVLY